MKTKEKLLTIGTEEFDKHMELILADHNGQITREPFYQKTGGLLQFYTKDCGTTTYPGEFQVSLDVARHWETKEIVGFSIWLPREVMEALNKNLAKPQPKKISWLKRKWRVLKVHWKYFKQKLEYGRSGKI